MAQLVVGLSLLSALKQSVDQQRLDPSESWPTSLGSPFFLSARALAGGEPPSKPGHRLKRSEMSCKPLLYGQKAGVFKQASNECSERYSAELECAGHHIRLARLQLGEGNSDWDTRAYIRKSRDPPKVDEFGFPIPADPNRFDSATRPTIVTTAKGSKAFREMTTNAGFMCENNTIVMYGGRFHWGFGKGKFPGLLRSEAKLTSDHKHAAQLVWSEPKPLLKGTTRHGFEHAFELNCSEGRKRYQGVCNLDGKLSVVHYRGRTLAFMRYNLKNNGWRHVQMTSSPIDKPAKFNQFQSLVFADTPQIKENNIYFFDVQALPDDSGLMAIFPATYGRGCNANGKGCKIEGGVYAALSDDGVHWGKPHMLMRSTVGASGVRSDDHPVDGFRLTRNKLTFDVDHGIELGHQILKKHRDAGVCRTPYTCTYEVSGDALKKLLHDAGSKDVHLVDAKRVLQLAEPDSEADTIHY